ncbi:MAG: hypothetical protein TREMPRED_004998 [Tremellales sp. Tagirdzhanova-0007]|nr:MAG: hypothetical protein TREMPRED_004998 [Tremellales sp. Tagirdzhanova-0007]
MSGNDISSRLNLRDGIKAPRYVFGTGGIRQPEAIHHAIQQGYRAFDTAQQYRNEAEVGEAIRSYPGGHLNRDELFIITKVNKPGSTVEETLDGIRESVAKIGLGGYVDLFLIHNPSYGPEGRRIQWLALEQAKKEGLARAIGVSNFVVHHLEMMKEYCTEMPTVNQTELSPWNQDRAVAALCKKEGIQLQAFAPIARGQKQDDPVLLTVAKQVNRHWNHVLLRWSWQRSFMVTCKSATPSRITDNVQIFDFSLNETQMATLNGLECGFKVTPSNLTDPEARRHYYEDMP